MWWAIFQSKFKRKEELSTPLLWMTIKALEGQKLTNSERKLMISLIVRRPYGVNAARSISIGRGTETQNVSMPEHRKGGKITQYWDYGMITTNGVRVRKALQPPQYPISRKFTPPPSPWVLVRSLMQPLNVLRRR